MGTQVTKPTTGFATGELVVLKPVQENDLAALAELMAECPLDGQPLPWTFTRLEKKFEDQDEPGLWGRTERWFTVVRRSGGIVGYLHEREEGGHDRCWNSFHVLSGLADCAELMVDLLTAYHVYRQTWCSPQRISFYVLRVEQVKIASLLKTGFELELIQEDMVFYNGRPEARCVYTWFSDELLKAPHWVEASQPSVVGKASNRSRPED